MVAATGKSTGAKMEPSQMDPGEKPGQKPAGRGDTVLEDSGRRSVASQKGDELSLGMGREKQGWV